MVIGRGSCDSLFTGGQEICFQNQNTPDLLISCSNASANRELRDPLQSLDAPLVPHDDARQRAQAHRRSSLPRKAACSRPAASSPKARTTTSSSTTSGGSRGFIAASTPGSKAHGWFGRAREGEGYEDIAFSPRTRRFYLLIEAEKHPDGTYKAMIDECDEPAQFKSAGGSTSRSRSATPGSRGWRVVRGRAGRTICSRSAKGTGAASGRKGRKPGGGRIQVLQRKGRTGSRSRASSCRGRVKFEDYSAVALRGTRIAVISQLTSRLWIGTLRVRDWTIAGRGRIYDFPRTKKRQAQVLHARRDVLAVGRYVRDGLGPVEGPLPRQLPQVRPVDFPVQPPGPTEKALRLRPDPALASFLLLSHR